MPGLGHLRDQTNGLVQRIFGQQAADQQVRFDEQFVVQPVEAPGSEPPGRQEATDAAVGNCSYKATLAQVQQGSEQDTGQGDGTRGDFQAPTRPAYNSSLLPLAKASQRISSLE